MASTDIARSLSRAVRILRILAGPNSNGLALTEISRRADIPHPTAHRLLRQLIVDGLVAIRKQRKYILGPLAFELGLAAASWFDFRSRSQQLITKLTELTGDTVYLSVRSGFDAVCIDRRDGALPLKGLTISVGSRLPLGVGVSGLAIISALTSEEIEEILAENASRLDQFKNLTLGAMRVRIAETQAHGFAVNGNLINLGVTAVGVALFDQQERPYGALCVAARNERMRASRQESIARLILEETGKISATLLE
jgi:DNA-binding IclR family transcriptional regulator